MADEAVVVTEEPAKAAPEVVETAPTIEAPASGETLPEAKTFSQEEVDAIVAKRLAKAERKREREIAAMRPAEAPQAPQAPTTGDLAPPKLTDYTDEAAYYKAVDEYADKKAERKAQQQAEEQRKAQTQRERQEMILKHAEREDEATEEFPDYVQVTRNPSLAITGDMLDAIVLSDIGHKIAYHLGKNPEEAARISKLHPVAQAKEIGMLEAKLSSAPAPSTSKAAPPIRPLKGSASVATDMPQDTDPVHVWKAKREAQIKARDAAKRSVR